MKIYDAVRQTGLPNFMVAKIPIPSALNIPAWEQLIQETGYQDNLIAGFLKYGFPINYQGHFPAQDGNHRNHTSATQYPEAIRSFLNTELEMEAIIGPFKTPCFAPPPQCSPLMTRPKSDSTERRVIMDLSWGPDSVNSHIDNSHYLGTEYKLALPTVDSVTEMILSEGQGCYLYKRDLSRAYKQLRTCPLAWPLTGLQFDNLQFIDLSVVFGLRPGGMMCQRTTEVIAHAMHHHNYRMCIYLDDMLGAQRQYSTAIEADTYLGQTLDRLGLGHKEAKHCPPAQQQVCLGLLFDTVAMTKSIPPKKLQEIKSELSKWSLKEHASRHELQSLCGKLLFVAKCSTPARLFINSLLADLRSAPETGFISLSHTTLSDINWFSEMMPLYNGRSLLHHPPLNPSHQVDLDGCLTGVGARSGDLYYSEQFPDFILQLNLSITHLEMLNILIAARIFAKQWAHHTVNLGCDNKAAVAVLQSARAKDRLLAACAKQLWMFATVYDFSLMAFHRSGEEMQAIGVDALSRYHLSQKFRNIVSNLSQSGRRVRVPPASFNLPPF